MSLRVLLADESDTIKKVFQLALQDMNVEVKTVQSGLDVVNVAQTFKPHIIFADVLLQKKNGYEMCLEVKQEGSLAGIPVVLMWSSFMELDQEQYKRSKADDQLEKPFDADHLRNLIKKHTPSVVSNPLSQFLKYPKSVSKETAGKKQEAPAATPMQEKPVNEEASEFNLNSIFEELTSVSDSMEPPPSFNDDALEMPALDSPANNEFDSFKIDTKVENLEKFESLNLTSSLKDDEPTPSPDFDNIQPMKLESVFKQNTPERRIHSEVSMTESELSQVEKTYVKNSKPVITQSMGLNDQEIEAIVRAHTEEFIKNQLQDTLLDIVERVVRAELTKVLEEEVRLKQELQDDSP
jgi:two-component system, cell cycle response regulator